MLKKLAIAILSVLTLSGITGCNSDSDYNSHLVLQTSVAVTGFTLEKNNRILNNLDSVYFSIDLDNAIIYNADSLPVGTPVDRLVVNISTDGSSVCELRFVNRNNVDTVVNYLTNSTDSINFSNGPVRMHLVSVDQANSRDYLIYVNVHKMKPDSLAWGQAYRRNLPSTFGVPSAQKTVCKGETLYCLTAAGNSFCLATSSHPEKGWNTKSVSFPFAPEIMSFASTDNALFVLSVSGDLYKSSDEGASWVSTGVKWYNILGGYAGTLVGISEKNGKYYHATYPATAETQVADNFPVSGGSQFYTYINKWSVTPQVIMVGGKNATGEYLNRTWGYDGSEWADLTVAGLPQASGYTLIPYYECTTDTISWRSKKADVLIAMGGRFSDGRLQPDVYVSKDLGFHWRKADTPMQLPQYLAPRYDAQAFVFSSVKTDVRKSAAGTLSDEWVSFPAPELPHGWVVAGSGITGRKRAVTPITEWETPYIYWFGGYGESGNLYNTVWRGVINRLEFRPLQ